MSENKANWSVNIKKLREEKGISQAQLAKEINISRPSVSSWEQEKGEPSIDCLIKIAKVLGVTVDMLVGNTFESKTVVVVDSSVIMKRPMIIDELVEKFDDVIIPDIVFAELNRLKDRGVGGNRGWLAMANLKRHLDEKSVIYTNCPPSDEINDVRIMKVAINRARESSIDRVYVFSDDIYFSIEIAEKKIPNLEYMSFNSYGKKFFTETSCDQVRSQEFFSLIRNNKLNEAKKFYKENQFKGLNVNIHDPETGYTPLIQAVRNKNLEAVEFLLKLPNIDMECCDRQKYVFTPLLHAAQLKNNAFEIFKKLIESGADYERGSGGQNAGNTPLMVCAWGGFKEGVRYLLEMENICVNQQDSNGYTAFIKACIKKEYEIAFMLLDRTDVTIRSRENKMAHEYLNSKDQEAHKLLQAISEKLGKAK